MEPRIHVLRELRAMRPSRRLIPYEARRIAEHQAAKLLRLRTVEGGPVPEEAISHLAHIEVARMNGMQSSGFAKWYSGRWHIVVNADHAHVRQRFTIAHELWHVLEHPFSAYALCEGTTEQLADHFAACLLMPKTWVKRQWGEGVHDTLALARCFGVSRAAMRWRIDELKLDRIDDTKRLTIRRRCGYEQTAHPYAKSRV
ncbi:MAG: ImmA/IrrE family metallo-endopeptidase [Solirubrobacteraceae bacterium]